VCLLIVAVASVFGSNCELASFADRVRSSLNFRHDVAASKIGLKSPGIAAAGMAPIVSAVAVDSIAGVAGIC
jgi:hypothetical protein